MLNLQNSCCAAVIVMVMAATIVISGCKTMSVSRMEQNYATSAPTDQVALTKEIQVKLKDKGFYDGPIDGISGPSTLSALRAYQKKWGLPSTNGINAKAYGQLSVWDSTRRNAARKRQAELQKTRKISQINSVRFISPKQTRTCKYIDQIVATAPLSFFGGIEQSEEWAREELKLKAAENGANGLRIVDRIFDKGRGGFDETRLTLYGDIYKCSQW